MGSNPGNSAYGPSAPYAVNVQVKADYTEDGVKHPGDWDRVAKLLSASGYKGYLALEYEAKSARSFEQTDSGVATDAVKIRVSQKSKASGLVLCWFVGMRPVSPHHTRPGAVPGYRT